VKEEKTVVSIFQSVARAVDGARLVRESLGAHIDSSWHPTAVLALGKVAFPMFDGVRPFLREQGGVSRALLIAPASRFPANPDLPPGAQALVADHPTPSERSLAAGTAAQAFVEALQPNDRLLVLISGGGSALVAGPAEGLSFKDKRDTVTAVARAGATIAELNAVRKHLSSIKGGRLALATRAQTRVLSLSDVVGNDPGTIASGPFSPDTSTFSDALAIVKRLAPNGPKAAIDHLQRGVDGAMDDTPKPGDPRLAHVDYRILASPERVLALGEAEGLARGLTIRTLARNTEEDVGVLAERYGTIAKTGAAAGTLFVGNGEPSIRVSGSGRGGRATHLALLMAQQLAGLSGVSFLSAGTDDRDGASEASGAAVDGDTWSRALSAGLDPVGALANCNSDPVLAELGCLVRGPGTSNLLDLHLLHFAG